MTGIYFLVNNDTKIVKKNFLVQFLMQIFFMKIVIQMILKKILIISTLCIAVNLPGMVHEPNSFSFNLPDEIVQALTNGDAKIISNYFNMSVELIINDSQAVYGRAQAEQILKTFFNNNASASGKFGYKQLHKGDRDNVQFYICELHTGKGSYRVTINMKDQRIHQMRIESND